MYFTADTYVAAAKNYAIVKRRNPHSVVSYMKKNPIWALNVVFLYLDRNAGLSKDNYPPMKNGGETIKNS